MSYLSPKEIERRAYALISKHETRYGPIVAPVPVEKIAESTLDLIIEWDSIREGPGETILAGLAPAQGKVVFNERRKALYESGGLYNTVLAHEIGHWVLHAGPVEKGQQPSLAGLAKSPSFVFRQTGPSTPVEWQAHTFMNYLVMPHKLLQDYIETEDLCYWSSLYHIRDVFEVTISAVTTRLRKMGLIFIDEDKKIYPGEGSYRGQLRMA